MSNSAASESYPSAEEVPRSPYPNPVYPLLLVEYTSFSPLNLTASPVLTSIYVDESLAVIEDQVPPFKL